MYSVVEIAGHQYRVAAGDMIDVQKLEAEVGTDVQLDKVLLIAGEKSIVGAPVVKGAKVVARVVRTDRDRKVIVFKRRPGGYRRKKGHRQHYTCLLVTEIHNGSGEISKIDASSAKAKKHLA